MMKGKNRKAAQPTKDIMPLSILFPPPPPPSASKDGPKLRTDLDDLIFQVAKNDPNKLRLKDFVKQQLLASINHSPDHPVYPVMIQEAITHLNEEKGSTKEAISEFIRGKYDVLEVVHPAKLTEQLEKLLDGNEIVLTSNNRFMLPVDEDACPVAKLTPVETGSSEGDTDFMDNVVEVDRIHEEQTEGPLSQNQLQEEQVNAIAEQRIEEIVLVEEQSTKVFEESKIEELELPGFQIESDEEHIVKRRKKDVTSELLCITAEQEKVIEEVAMGHVSGANDDERCVEEIQDRMEEAQADEDLSHTNGQALKTLEDRIEVIEDVACGKHVKGANDNRRCMGEIPDQTQDTAATVKLSDINGQASRKLGNKMEVAGQLNYMASLLPSLLLKKEIIIDLRKRMKTFEGELKDIIDSLSVVDLPEQDTSQPMLLQNHLKLITSSSELLFIELEELMMGKQNCCSEPLAQKRASESHLVACSSNTPLMSQVLDSRQQSDLPSTTIKDAEVPVNLENLEREQDKQVDLSKSQFALEGISDMEEEVTTTHMIIDAEQVKHEKSLHKISETIPSVGLKLPMEEKSTGLEIIVEQIPEKQCGEVKKFRSNVESMLEKEQHVEISREGYHPDFKQNTLEKLAQEVISFGEVEMHKIREIKQSDEERQPEVQSNVQGKQCQINQKINRQQVQPPLRHLSESELDGNAGMLHSQLQNSNHSQEPGEIIVDRSSQAEKKQVKGRGKGECYQREKPPLRQLRLCRPKTFDSDPDLDLTISSMKLEGKKKLNPSELEKAKEGNNEKLEEELSRLSEQELESDHGQPHKQIKHRNLRLRIHGPHRPDEAIEHLLLSHGPRAKKGKWQHDSQERPHKLKSHKVQVLKIERRGRPRKDKIGERLTKGKPTSDHRNHDKKLPRKDGRGWPLKLNKSSGKICDTTLQLQDRRQELQPEDEGQDRQAKRSKTAAAKAGFTLSSSNKNHALDTKGALQE